MKKSYLIKIPYIKHLRDHFKACTFNKIYDEEAVIMPFITDKVDLYFMEGDDFEVIERTIK